MGFGLDISAYYLYPKPFHRPLCFKLDLVLIGLDKLQAEALRALCTCQTVVANDSGLPSHWQALLTSPSIIPPDADALATISMSLSPPTTSSSNLHWKAIFESTMNEYQRKTKKYLFAHPLGSQLQACDSPYAMLVVLQAIHGQIQNFERSMNIDEIFDCMENFFRRLELYIAAPMAGAMKAIIVKIMTEVIVILGFVTKEEGRMSKSIADDTFPVADKDLERYLRKLIGRRDIQDAQRGLDRLMEEETRVLAALAYVTRNVGTRVETVNN